MRKVTYWGAHPRVIQVNVEDGVKHDMIVSYGIMISAWLKLFLTG
jgi:hypothetical protein